MIAHCTLEHVVSVLLCRPHLGRCANPFFTPDAELFSGYVDGNHEFETHLFDGVAAIALAMNAANEDAAEQAQGKEARSDGETLLEKLLNVSFDGTSGPVALDSEGDREPATIRFALESFGDPFSAEPLSLTYEVFVSATSTTFEMAATAAAPVQWIVGSEGPNSQPEDAITRKVPASCCLPLATQASTIPSNVSFSAQTHGAHASVFARKWQLLDKREAVKQTEREAARRETMRETTMVVATSIGLLIAIVATLGLTTWSVRVRRVAHLYQVTGRHLNLALNEQQIG